MLNPPHRFSVTYLTHSFAYQRSLHPTQRKKRQGHFWLPYNNDCLLLGTKTISQSTTTRRIYFERHHPFNRYRLFVSLGLAMILNSVHLDWLPITPIEPSLASHLTNS